MVVSRTGQLELPMSKWAHHGIMSQFLKVNKVGLDTYHNLLQNEFLPSCYFETLWCTFDSTSKEIQHFCKWDTEGFKNNQSFSFKKIFCSIYFILFFLFKFSSFFSIFHFSLNTDLSKNVAPKVYHYRPSNFAHMLASYYFQGHEHTITYLGHLGLHKYLSQIYHIFGSDKIIKLHVVYPLYLLC